MCQYSATEGFANDWHFVHLASRAVGGAGLVLTEATAVSPEGRISPDDLGLWSDAHIGALARIVRFMKGEGSCAGIQLAHAGRKASTYRPSAPTHGQVPVADGGWEPVAPSAIPFSDTYPQPRAMTAEDIQAAIGAFKAAAERALHAGFDVVEVHAAHGYLIHEFLSPLSNQRDDEWGGPFEHRIRFLIEVVQAVRTVWPERLPLWVRISATDWTPGGWDSESSIELARRLGGFGVDLIDCSTGGNVHGASIPIGPGYQVPFAEEIRRAARIATGAVGLITTPAQAQDIVAREQADCVIMARELLRDPYWPLRAARELAHDVPWSEQYLRAAPTGAPTRQAR
mgnify:CR=1 FL=1